MKILIIGLGSIGKKHVDSLFFIKKDIEIFGLRSGYKSYDIDGVTNIYNITDSKIIFDFAIISNPTHLHFKYIEELMLLEIPLFIEKPPLHTLRKASYLSNAIERKKIITYVACNLRFHPCIQFIKKTLNEDKLNINEVNVYCGSYLPSWRPDQNFKNTYSANAKMGGGVHLDLFHEIDYTTWLFGLPNKSNSLIRSSSFLKIDVIDYANYNLEYDTFTANIILNYYRKKPKREIEIVTENNILTIDLINNYIKNDSGKYIYKNKNFQIKDTYVQQLKYFIDCLTEKNTPMNSFKESLENLKICLKNEE